MKGLNQSAFLLILSLLFVTACASKTFIPLYKETQSPAQIPVQTALLSVPIQIDLIYHNGEQQNFTPAYKPQVNYRLLPGKHLLGFRYQDLHYDEDGNHDVITSKTTLLSFIAEAGKDYKVDFKKPENYLAAKQLETSFQISLSQNNQLIASSFPADEKIQSKPLFSFSTTDFDPDTKELFTENEPDLSNLNTPPQSSEDAIVHLKYWWQTASKKEQNNFREWLKTN